MHSDHALEIRRAVYEAMQYSTRTVERKGEAIRMNDEDKNRETHQTGMQTEFCGRASARLTDIAIEDQPPR